MTYSNSGEQGVYMKIVFCVMCNLFIITSFVFPSKKGVTMNTALSDMISREREFAQYSYDYGIKKAFLAYLTDASIMFRPQPVPGRSIYEQYPDTFTAMLRWAPEFADCASSGDVGYTYGPWQYSKEKDALPVAYGNYFTVWEKLGNGWFIFIDLGISYEDVNDLNVQCVTPIADKKTWHSNGAAIDTFESAIATMTAEKGYDAAVTHYTAENAMIFRDGRKPMTKTEFQAMVPQDSHAVSIVQMGLKISQALDMYAVYGVLQDSQTHSDKASFVRVMRLTENGWKIIADLRLDYPINKE